MARSPLQVQPTRIDKGNASAYHPTHPHHRWVCGHVISGFKASDIGQYGIENLDWWTGPSLDYDPWGVPVPVGALYDIFRPWLDPPARTYLPPVGVFAPPTTQSDYVGTPIGVAEVPVTSAAESVIDPEFRPQATVFESVPGGIYETTRAETDWDAVYDAYVILNPPEEVEDVPFHSEIIDWGATIIGGILDPVGIGDAIRTAYMPAQQTLGVTGLPSLGQQTSLQPAPVASIGGVTMQNGCPPVGPKYAKICLATNVITPLRRRRRRRLLTSSDIKDLSALKSIVGGAALQAAVTQAVRR